MYGKSKIPSYRVSNRGDLRHKHDPPKPTEYTCKGLVIFPTLTHTRKQEYLSLITNAETWLLILSFLPSKDLMRFSQACRLSDLIVHSVVVQAISPLIFDMGKLSTNDFLLWTRTLEYFIIGDQELRNIKRSEYAPFMQHICGIESAGKSESEKKIGVPNTTQIDKITKAQTDKVTKAQTDKVTKTETDKVTKTEVDKLTKVQSDKVTRADVDKVGKTQMDRPVKRHGVSSEKELLQGITRPEPAKIIPPPEKKSKKWLPINVEDGKYYCGLIFEDLEPTQIAFCDIDRPMRHTCLKSKILKGGKFFCSLITLGEFITEVYKRSKTHMYLEPETLANINESFNIVMLQHYLRIVMRIIVHKERGEVYFRRVEYIHTTQIEVHHRLWFQILLGHSSGKEIDIDRKGLKEYQLNVKPYGRRLYLTLYDHYHWVS